MVQEKIGSNQSAVDVPKCKYTQCFNKGPGDLTPKFHKHQPLARSLASTVTSKAREPCLLIKLALSSGRGDGSRSWG